MSRTTDNEVIRGRAGPLTIVASRPLPGTERVYNLTVEGEHVYYVSELGLLAHNNCPTDDFVGPFPVGTSTPLKPNAYSVIFETTINSATLAQPNRYLHTAEANAALLQMVQADGDGTFATSLRRLLPGFETRVQGKTKVLGVSPGRHVTWHHVPNSNRLQLVYRYQHAQSRLKGPVNEIYQNLFHPNGGRGGFADGTQ